MTLRLLCFATALFSLAAATPARTQETRDTLALPGLAAPVEILHDAWGIAHIYAENEHDLFFAQGFNAARDRLFQLDMWRRRATGTIAALMGSKALDHDIGARLLSFRGDMRKEMEHYHPRGGEIISAFVEGINAYIELARQNADLLPIEFAILNVQPEKWTPEIVVSRHNGLFRNASREIRLARMVRRLGPAPTSDLLDLQPGTPDLAPDGELDLSLIDDHLLRFYRAARSPVEFEPADVVPAYRPLASEEQSGALCSGLARGCIESPGRLELAQRLDLTGSNNWVISGKHTFSGNALMANDPHRMLAVPSLRYWVHLVAPGWDVIGGGEPALPGVAIGHNEYGAWGLTIFAVDQEDLYVYDTNPTNVRQYRYRGRWRDMDVVSERFDVRGSAPVTVELRFTRHGPVIAQDSVRHKAYALRAAWLEAGAAPYLASLRIDQAANWKEFRAACSFFRTPSENMVWADAAGNIGWQATGITPRRQGWDGLLPVPGDGRYEWDGFLPILDLPNSANPPEGWIATANENNLPPGYAPVVGYEWADPFRVSRIAEVLASGRRLTLMDMQRLQHDVLSIPGRSLVGLLSGLDIPRGAISEAADRLLAWNHVLHRDAVAPTIYVFWEWRLRENLWKRLVPEDAWEVFRPDDLSLRKVIDLLTVPDGQLGAHPTQSRDAILVSSLQEAVAELSELLGPDQDGWKYRTLKHVFYEHLLSPALRNEVSDQLDIGPLARGGYGYTVNNTSNNLNQTSGATFRIIVDTGEWDRSVGTSAPGQSGDPDSPHYADLFVPWAAGRYFPVLYSREKVEAVTDARTVLLPR